MPGNVWQRTVVDEAGNVMPLASVEVRDQVTSSLVQLYSNYALSSTIGNPITADADGFVRFYTAAGRYRIVATSGAQSRTWEDEVLGLDSALFEYSRTAAEIAASVTPVSKQYAELHAFRYMTSAQITDVTTRAGSVDVRAALQNMINVAQQNGGKAYCPAGKYLIRSTNSPDSQDNGLHIPFTSVFGFDAHMILEGDGRATEFIAGDNAMTVIRLSDSHTKLLKFAIRGNSKTTVTGISLIGSDTSDTTLAEHIDWNTIDVDVSDCAEGMEMEAPSSGGCYWNKVYGSYYNNTRHIRLRDHAISKGCNRNEFYVNINGGNTGIYIDGADTNYIMCRFEEVAVGTSPLAIPTAIYINSVGSLGGLQAQNTTIFGSMFEDCTRDLDCSNARTYIFGGNCGESGAIAGSAHPYVLIGGDTLARMREVTFGSPTLDGLTLSPRSSALNTFANAYVGTSADAAGAFPFQNDGSLILKSRSVGTTGIAFVTGATPTLRAYFNAAGQLVFNTMPGDFADDAAANAGGVPVGALYRTASVLKIRVA
jgi:hypothetical protein